MKRFLAAIGGCLLFAGASSAQEPEGALSPNAIVETAPAEEWVAIAPEDLLVMDLAPDRDGNARRVVIQLMPPPFSQGWAENIRALARAGWYDGVSVNRVQDNYVVQWGDATEEKPLPEGLRVMAEGDYIASISPGSLDILMGSLGPMDSQEGRVSPPGSGRDVVLVKYRSSDPYTEYTGYKDGIPVGVKTFQGNRAGKGFGWAVASAWPVHCYGMVGVGRGYSPDTGSGAELYTVIGHAPRHLDRNIALVGRVVEGIEHLSSLPRGTGDLGFYEDAEQRVPIERVRIGSDLPNPPRFEYLSTEGETFARYAEARANRRDPFFIQPAGGADICNIPVPVRRAS